MEVLGATTGAKAALVAGCWALGAATLWWALKLSPQEQKTMRRSGETLFIRLVSFLPAFVTRWFYILLGLALLVLPLLAFTGVIPWQ